MSLINKLCYNDIMNNRRDVCMLDFDIALELLQKYGFSSNEHPYLFYSEPDVGLCILVDDEHYGKLERRKIFKEIEVK